MSSRYLGREGRSTHVQEMIIDRERCLQVHKYEIKTQSLVKRYSPSHRTTIEDVGKKTSPTKRNPTTKESSAASTTFPLVVEMT